LLPRELDRRVRAVAGAARRAVGVPRAAGAPARVGGARGPLLAVRLDAGVPAGDADRDARPRHGHARSGRPVGLGGGDGARGARGLAARRAPLGGLRRLAMRGAARYARLLGLQLRMSAVTSMQYRADFIIKGLISVVWLAVALIPLVSVFQRR